jgi:hypothetical protein
LTGGILHSKIVGCGALQGGICLCAYKFVQALLPEPAGDLNLSRQPELQHWIQIQITAHGVADTGKEEKKDGFFVADSELSMINEAESPNDCGQTKRLHMWLTLFSGNSSLKTYMASLVELQSELNNISTMRYEEHR